MQLNLSLPLIKIIIRRRHQIRHTRLTPVFFYLGIRLRFLLYISGFSKEEKNTTNTNNSCRKFEMVNFCANLIVELTLYFFECCCYCWKQTTTFQPSYMNCCVHILFNSNRAWNIIRLTTKSSIHFTIHSFFSLSFVHFFFVHGCFCAAYAMHSHSEHIHFLASNNISNKKKKYLTYRQIHFDSNCMFFFFLCAFSCLFLCSFALPFMHYKYVWE